MHPGPPPGMPGLGERDLGYAKDVFVTAGSRALELRQNSTSDLL